MPKATEIRPPLRAPLPSRQLGKPSYSDPSGSRQAARELTLKIMSAREAKNGFGLMIDTARAEPVLIEKHGRRVLVVVSVEEYARLIGTSNAAPMQANETTAMRSRGKNWTATGA